MRTLIALALLSGCTTLGPNPVTTGISAVPTDRPGMELGVGVAPAFYLSDAADDGDGEGATTQQAHALIEPDRLLGTKGVILGARTFGDGGDGAIEPVIGYRRKLDQAFSLAGVIYGGRADGESNGAWYKATRAGGELVIDAAIESAAKWVGLHLHASLSATYLDARGEYCVTSSGAATDCDDGTRRVSANVEGIYTAATAGVSLDIARRPTGYVHGVRLSLISAVGAMPSIRDGQQQPSDNGFFSLGLGLTLGFGAPN